MNGVPEDLSVNARHYIEVWVRALGVFLGWNETQVLRWAQQHYDALRADENWFCREDEIHYIVPLLVPEDLHKALSPEELADLRRRLAISIRVGAVHFPPRITELMETLPVTPEATREIGEFRRKAQADGTWFSESLDKYDWEAAKARIREILADYRGGDRLPNLVHDLFAPDPIIRERAAEAVARMGKVAAPAKKQLIEVVRRFADENAVLFALDALRNLDDPSADVLEAVSCAARSPDPSIKRKARYVHYALSLEKEPWDDK